MSGAKKTEIEEFSNINQQNHNFTTKQGCLKVKSLEISALLTSDLTIRILCFRRLFTSAEIYL